MGNGYKRAGGADLYSQIADRNLEVNRQLEELQVATGTQTGSLVSQVKAKLAELDSTVNALVAAALSNYYTKPETVAIVASPGTISPTTVNASGVGMFNAGLKSTDVYSHLVTGGGAYSATWTNIDGTIGTAPSSRRFKQDIHPAEIDTSVIERMEVVQFRYKDAVTNVGDDAAVTLGGIAEQFIDAGAGFAVNPDADGEPFSIEDRPVLYALLKYTQQLAARVRELESK